MTKQKEVKVDADEVEISWDEKPEIPPLSEEYQGPSKTNLLKFDASMQQYESLSDNKNKPGSPFCSPGKSSAKCPVCGFTVTFDYKENAKFNPLPFCGIAHGNNIIRMVENK